MRTSLFFIAAAVSLAHAETAQEIQLADRIEAHVAGAKITFSKCHLSKCSTVGSPNGYTSIQISEKNDVSRGNSFPVGQLLMNTAEGDAVLAMFKLPAEYDGHPVKSAVCKLDSTISEFLNKASRSKEKNAYDFKATDFKQIGCSLGEDGPAFEDASRELKKVLSQN